MSQTFYWYDLETFGIDPKTSRISQFAGLRTDMDLNPIGEPLVHYCQPASDFLPDPEASLITGISPQKAIQEGLPERDFIAKIHAEFSKPDTCVLGYNSLRFDDEHMRYSLYRNFYDPYAREWQNGCSRWDIIDMVRLCRALRPEGINWPMLEDGTPSNKLELITQANGISHEQAHDAMSDVYATIAVAKLIKDKQPRLWDFCLNNRDKRKLASQLKVAAKEPMIHVSGMYGLARSSTAIIVPVALHPSNKNGVIVYDLADDPSELLALDADGLAERIFTARNELPEGLERIGLKTIHLNKCPIIAPLKTLSPEAAKRLGINIEEQLARIEPIRMAAGLENKVQQAFSNQQFEPLNDPDQSLYSGGFIGNNDKHLMQDVVMANQEELAHFKALPFQDQRLGELLFRYRARNYPQSLELDEQQRWAEHCRERIHDGVNGYLNLDQFQHKLMQLAQEHENDPAKLHLLKQLAEYAEWVA